VKIDRAQSSTQSKTTARSLDTDQLLERIIDLGRDRKANSIVAIDIREISTLADYFVIMSGSSEIQIRAIAGAIRETLRHENVRTIGSEGSVTGHWLVLDYGDVIVHVFHDETRLFYDLEGLWGDAPRVFG